MRCFKVIILVSFILFSSLSYSETAAKFCSTPQGLDQIKEYVTCQSKLGLASCAGLAAGVFGFGVSKSAKVYKAKNKKKSARFKKLIKQWYSTNAKIFEYKYGNKGLSYEKYYDNLRKNEKIRKKLYEEFVPPNIRKNIKLKDFDFRYWINRKWTSSGGIATSVDDLYYDFYKEERKTNQKKIKSLKKKFYDPEYKGDKKILKGKILKLVNYNLEEKRLNPQNLKTNSKLNSAFNDVIKDTIKLSKAGAVEGAYTQGVLSALRKLGAAALGGGVIGGGAYMFFDLGTGADGCSTRTGYYTNLDGENGCKPNLKINKTVADFLTLPASEQLTVFKENPKVCDYYKDLHSKLLQKPKLGGVKCKGNRGFEFKVKAKNEKEIKHRVSTYPDGTIRQITSTQKRANYGAFFFDKKGDLSSGAETLKQTERLQQIKLYINKAQAQCALNTKSSVLDPVGSADVVQ